MAGRGEGHHWNKISEDFAIQIRRNFHKFTIEERKQVAAFIGVSVQTLTAIAMGKSWKHLNVPVNSYWDTRKQRQSPRGDYPSGTDHANTRMSTEFATAVRLHFHKLTVSQQKEFARLSGFHHISLRDVARGKSWKHLDVPVNPYWLALKRGRKSKAA